MASLKVGTRSQACSVGIQCIHFDILAYLVDF